MYWCNVLVGLVASNLFRHPDPGIPLLGIPLLGIPLLGILLFRAGNFILPRSPKEVISILFSAAQKSNG